MKRPKIIIVGAGISGLSCARELEQNGVHVHVIEENESAGGRCKTTNTDFGTFDYGTQYFTARTEEFKAMVAQLGVKNSVAKLNCTIKRMAENGSLIDLPKESRYVGVPSMGGMADVLASGLSITYSTRVTSLAYSKGQWDIAMIKENQESVLRADILVLAIPIDQILRFNVSSKFEVMAGEFRMSPSWAVMLAFNEILTPSFSALMLRESVGKPLSWMMKETAKNCRDGSERWVLHAGPVWTRNNMLTNSNEVVEVLYKQFREITGATSFSFSDAKLWRYAAGGRSNDFGFFLDSEKSVMGCGDWANGGRIEGAWLSGKAAAEKLLKICK